MTTSNPEPDFINTGIIIAAGGSSSRFGENKLFANVSGKPVFIHTIERFVKLFPLENFIITVPEKDIREFRKYSSFYLKNTAFRFVPGGETRTLSVKNGLDALPANLKLVAVHDAARPFVSTKAIYQCLEYAGKYDGAAVARPITDTIKIADESGIILRTADRKGMWSIETPQIFKLPLLKKAYSRAVETGGEFTDDAGIMEAQGHKIFLVPNTTPNIKITFQDDITAAEQIYASLKTRQ